MTYRSSTSAVNSGTDTHPGSAPSGLQASDVQLAIMGGPLLVSSLPWNAPAGWTSVQELLPGGGASHMQAWTAAGTVSNYTWTTAVGNATANIQIFAFSGRDTASPITASAMIFDDSGFNELSAPSVSAAAGDDLVCAWMVPLSPDAWTGLPPTGFTVANNATDGTGFRQGTAYQDAVSAGATGAQTITTGNGFQKRIAATFAIKAAGGGGAALRSQACL